MMGLKKIFLSLLCSVLLAGWASAQDTTDTSQGSYFLSFVKKVYFNPTILLATQDFHEQHNVRVLVLPDLNGAEDNQITGFERGMQKIIRFLIEGDDEGSIRFYFDAEDTESPFSFVYAEELHCKFTTADKDSIVRLLNAPFHNATFNLNSHALFEASIEGALAYAGKCLQHVTAQCGEMPEHATTEINTKPLAISVHTTSGTHYDIDYKQHDLLESHYAKAHDVFTDQDWYAPSKFMVAGGDFDEPIAIAINKHETLFKKQNLVFRTLYNNQIIPIEPSSTNDTIKLLLPKDLPSGNPVEVSVKYTSTVDSIQYTVGFFMVYVYEPKEVKLNILAANGYTLGTAEQTAIENQLKAVYDPVGVHFVVEKKEWMPDSEWSNNITIESSGLLSNYSPDLRDWVDGVQELNDYDEEEYYLVFGLNTQILLGYMPRSRNIGFVFAGAANPGKTAAHELGHGIYHLRHIFAEEELGQDGLSTTQNIMDYSTIQNDLYLHQWKFIDDPASVSWFGGDDGEGSALGPSKGLSRVYRNKDLTVCLFAPNKQIIKLPKNVYRVYFSDGNDEHHDAPKLLASGLLMQFELCTKINGQYNLVTYSAQLSGTLFLGYKKTGTKEVANFNDENMSKFYGPITSEFTNSTPEYFDSYLTPAPSDSGLIIFNNGLGQCTYYKFQSSEYPYITSDAQSSGTNLFLINGSNPNDFKIKGFDLVYLGSGDIAVEGYDVSSFTLLQLLNGESNINDRIWILSKIAELRSDYPGMYNQMSTSKFNQWHVNDNTPSQIWISISNAWDATYTTLATLTEEESLVETFFKSSLSANKSFFDQYYYEYNLANKTTPEVWLRFLNCFRYLIINYQQVFADDINKISNIPCSGVYLPNVDMTADRLLTILEVLDDYTLSEMCAKKRLALINNLLNPNSLVNVYGIVWDRYELGILKLLKSANKDISYDLLKDLCTIKSDDELLIQRMVDGIDDETCWIGTDNFTDLMNWFIKTYSKHQHDLTFLVDPNAIPTASQIKLIKERTVTYNYTGFVKRLFNSIVKLSVAGSLIDGDEMTEVSFTDSDKVSVKNYTEVCFMDLTDAPVREFDPLTPVVIVDEANLVDVNNPTNFNGGFVAPAIILYFLESKAGARTTEAIIQTVADVASLAIPGGAAFKVLTYADKISSIASLSGSYLEDDYPELSRTLNLTSSILGLGSMSGDIFFSGFKSVDNLDEAVDLIHSTNPDIIQTIKTQNYSDNMITMENRIKDAVNPNAPTTPVRTADRSMLDNNSARGMLIDVIENERNTLQAGGYLSDVSHYNQMLTKIKNYKNLFTDNFFYRQFSSLTDNWDASKLFKNSSKIPSEKILEVVNADEVRLFNKTSFSSIGTEAEFVGSFHDARYFDGVSATTTKTGDIYIYRENGNLKVFCLTGGSCFTENTLVSLKEGYTTIDKVKVNDSVKCFDEVTGVCSYKRVKNVFQRKVNQLIRLVIGTDTLFTTAEHPFFTANGWQTARNLVAATLMFTSSGQRSLASIDWIDSTTIVHNFEVEDFHTYLVGKGGVYVHNGCNVINGLLESGKLKPQHLQSFIDDFAGNSAMLAKFNDGTLSVRAWEILRETSLKANVDALIIVEKYVTKFPANGTKIKNFLTNITQYQWPSGGIGNYSVLESLNKVYEKNLKQLFPNLSGEELVAIHHYSRGISYPFNQAKRGFGEMTEFFTTFDEFLGNGLSKLDDYPGTVYRGTAVQESYVFSKYQNAFLNGTAISEEAYTSTSKVTDFLSDYMNRNVNQGDVNVVFNIQSKTGKDIEQISNFGSKFPENVNHKEVLFRPNVQFNVTNFVPKYNANNELMYYEIFLSEL